MKNWIQGWSHIDGSKELVTSNSDITRVIENVKDLITKEKTSKLRPQRQKDQLSTSIETEEHRGHTRAISSIVSWKEWFVKDIHMYKKCGRHDKDEDFANNDEEQFATKFFNFMRKHPDIVISQLSTPQINLDIGTGFTLSSADSAPDNQKTIWMTSMTHPFTLLYVKGKTLRTIEVADAIVMATCIMHGGPVLSECVVAEVTTIREGHEFKTLTIQMKRRGLRSRKMLKGISSYGPVKI
jgi:predicted metal-binding protein